MSKDGKRTASTSTPAPAQASIQVPHAPPLPAPQPRPFQRAKDVASRFLGYPSRPASPQDNDHHRFSHGARQFMRSASLSAAQDATASHRTGLEIKTISINESGTHAIIAGVDIFKTVRIEHGRCAEDLNLRTAIRSTPTQASGQPRQVYSIDIADVAWAKGDTGNFVAAATSSGKIIVYDLGHAALQAAQLHEHFRQVHNVTFNPHRGSLLLSGSQDGTVRLWDVRDARGSASTVQSKRKFSGQSDGVRDVKWSPTEGLDFAFGTDTGEIQRWDMRNLNAPKVRIPAHMRACNTVDWHPDGKHIVSAGSDKTIRVFDVSNSRTRKASWEIRTAHPVMNVRWRPSCQSMMPQDNGAGLCTQVIAAYQRDQPMLHIWDFRRPYLPFREMNPYPSAPTDLLWHSQDLLWTVGREGILRQIDIQHTPKIIDRLHLQTVNVSPLNELAFVTQARQQRRLPKPQPVPSAQIKASSLGTSTSPENHFLSRSWGDDSLDSTFLSILPVKRQARSGSTSRFSNAVSNNTSNQKHSATIKLDDILTNRKSFRPHQMACRGVLPSHNNREFVAELAGKLHEVFVQIPAASAGGEEAFIQTMKEVFEMNATVAEKMGFLQTSQTWKIVSHCTIKHLENRLGHKRKHETEKRAPNASNNIDMAVSIESIATRLAAQHLKSPPHSPGSLRPASTVAHQLAMPESTSNVPTPLARPSLSGKYPDSRQQHAALPDPDHERILLPPSLASAEASRPPVAPASPFADGQLTITNLTDMQVHQTHAEEAERNEMVRRWSKQANSVLDLDPVDRNGVKIPPSKLEHHGSGESFHFLEDSAGSRETSFPASFESRHSASRSMVAAHPARKLVRQATFETEVTTENEYNSAAQSMMFTGSGTLANSAVATMQNSDEDLKNVADTTDFAAGRDNHATEREPAHTRHAVEDRIANESPPRLDLPLSVASPPDEKQTMHSPADLLPVDSPDGQEADLEERSIWTLIEMLQKLLQHYTAEAPSAHMASLLLLCVGPLLPRTHPLPAAETSATIASYVEHFSNKIGWDVDRIPALIARCFEQPVKAGINPLQVESILSTYHEQLLRYQLFEEAAILRQVAYPAYPAVYEDFLGGVSVALACGSCSKSLSSQAGHVKCTRCRQMQSVPSCPICWMASSPYGNGGKLLSSCLLCGHTTHAACSTEWFERCKGDGCPTEGCLCDCVAGKWRDEKMAEAEAERRTNHQQGGREPHRRVKSDEWKARESAGVAGVRKALLG